MRTVTVEGPNGVFDHLDRLKAKALPGIARGGNLQLEGAAAAAVGYKPIEVTEAWLVGTWGPTRTKNAHQSCDTDVVVSFARDGTFYDGESHGRYRLNGRTITYYNRVLVGEGEETEDRSQYNDSVERVIFPLSNQSMQEDGDTLYRCSNE